MDERGVIDLQRHMTLLSRGHHRRDRVDDPHRGGEQLGVRAGVDDAAVVYLNGTEIWRTLKAYLECSCNINHTAEKLFIHRNTLYARLAIIRSLIPLDDMDQNDLLYLRVSYFLCERIQQFEPLEDEARAIFG